jgi:hypothetical protein
MSACPDFSSQRDHGEDVLEVEFPVLEAFIVEAQLSTLMPEFPVDALKVICLPCFLAL